MQELNNTQYFKVEAEKDLDVRDVIAAVYSALTERVQSGQSDCWIYYVW